MLNPNYALTVPINGNDNMQGSMNAPITLLEYGDYECPHCGQAFPIVKQLQNDFGDKLLFVFRNFPLTQIHEHAFKAAEAAEIAADFGKFWEMHDTLLINQKYLNDPFLLKYAINLGLDELSFIESMQNHSKTKKVRDDFMSGVESGVNGTPSFFINGYKYDGDFSYHTFKAFLNKLLNKME